jgi:hypothetical protein
MTGEVRVEASPVGPVVRPLDPKEPAELVILYLHGDRYLRALRSRRSAWPGGWLCGRGAPSYASATGVPCPPHWRTSRPDTATAGPRVRWWWRASG